MTIHRIKLLSELPKGRGLKPLPCPSFKEARRLHRDKSKTIYYYKRRFTRKFPPLMFIEVNEPAPQPEPLPEPVALEQMTMF